MLDRVVSDPIRRPFTSKEFDLCIEYMAKNDRALYLCTILLGYLAIRPGEERNLKVGAFDFQRGLVRSPARNSKNNKDSNVTIPADILPMLENFGLKSYPEGYYVFGKAQGWHNVQLTPAPERIGENTLAHRFRVAIAELKKQGKLNNTKGLELHSLKDTLALYLLNNGVDVVSAMHHIWQNSLEVFQWYIKRLGVVNEKIRSLPVRALP